MKLLNNVVFNIKIQLSLHTGASILSTDGANAPWAFFWGGIYFLLKFFQNCNI